MKINHVSPRDKPQDLQEKTKPEKSKQTTSAQEQSGGKLKTDTVSISEQARSLQRTESEMKVSKGRPESDPGVREDKVGAAKAKLAGGKLLTDEVVARTADAIVKSGSLADIVKGKELIARLAGMEHEVEGFRQSKLDEVKQKMEAGFYNSSSVTDQVAERIMEDLLV